jgi:nitric oxide reductase subunit B
MQTLPQINLFTHGTQWTTSHAHLAFFGAYATINIAMFYIAAQRLRGDAWMGADLPGHGWKWKGALTLITGGVVGMTIALLIAGYVESFVERAREGSTWAAYFAAQTHPWFEQAMVWRQVFGFMTAAGVVLLVWDLATIGKGETRTAPRPAAEAA